MTQRERLLAAVEGRRPDRVPVSFWRHFPDLDHDADQLAEAMIAFQRHYDLDLVKLMPSGMYGTEDFGCEAGDPDPVTGAKRLLHGPVESPADWRKLFPPPPERGARGRELKCLRTVRRALGPGVPILQTVFSPSTTAAKIAGRDRFLHMLRTAPDEVRSGLETITRAEEAYVAACVEAGADGVFFATQLAGDGLLTEAEYRTFGVPYDLRVLRAVGPGPSLSMVHVHGVDILFSLFGEYPAPLLNWHDRRTPPDLVEGRSCLARGAVAGGLDEWGIVREGPPARLARDVRQVLQATGGWRHLLAPGCVVPLTVPASHLEAVRQAVDDFVIPKEVPPPAAAGHP